MAWVALLGMAGGVCAQEQKPGPVTPPPKREIKRLPAPVGETPPMPLEEMVLRFAKNEEALKRLYETSDYRLSVRVQEFEEDGSAGGEWRVVSEVTTKPDGTRVGRIVEQPRSTLKRARFEAEDLEALASLPQFILTPDQRNRYEITYFGRQPLDELTVYIFRVQPRRLERKVRQFEGLLYVDERDFAVVKTYGRMVTEVEEENPLELPFKTYETYREPVDNQHWLPTYTRAEDTIKSEAGEARLRLTIRISDYKLHEATTPKPKE